MANSEPEAPVPPMELELMSQTPKKHVCDPEEQHETSTATPKLSFVFCAVCVICLVILILIVYLSDGKSTGTWIPRVPAIQPSILISLLATLFNTFEFFILADGLTIAWWRAFHNGATLRELHYIRWNGLKETWRAFRASHNTRRVLGVLVVASIIRIYDAPLLQRSIRPVVSEFASTYKDTWTLPDNITEG